MEALISIEIRAFRFLVGCFCGVCLYYQSDSLKVKPHRPFRSMGLLRVI